MRTYFFSRNPYILIIIGLIATASGAMCFMVGDGERSIFGKIYFLTEALRHKVLENRSKKLRDLRAFVRENASYSAFQLNRSSCVIVEDMPPIQG